MNRHHSRSLLIRLLNFNIVLLSSCHVLSVPSPPKCSDPEVCNGRYPVSRYCSAEVVSSCIVLRVFDFFKLWGEERGI